MLRVACLVCVSLGSGKRNYTLDTTHTAFHPPPPPVTRGTSRRIPFACSKSTRIENSTKHNIYLEMVRLDVAGEVGDMEHAGRGRAAALGRLFSHAHMSTNPRWVGFGQHRDKGRRMRRRGEEESALAPRLFRRLSLEKEYAYSGYQQQCEILPPSMHLGRIMVQSFRCTWGWIPLAG